MNDDKLWRKNDHNTFLYCSVGWGGGVEYTDYTSAEE